MSKEYIIFSKKKSTIKATGLQIYIGLDSFGDFGLFVLHQHFLRLNNYQHEALSSWRYVHLKTSIGPQVYV